MKTAIFSIGVFLISLFLGSCQPSETSCSVVDTGKALDYKMGEKLLFSYNYATVYPVSGVDSVYKRSGFIHPLKTLGGEVMTNCSPADHYHHSVYGMPGRKPRSKETRSTSGTSTKNKGQSASATSNAYPTTVLSPHWIMWSTLILPQKVAMNERLEINIGTTSLPGYYIDYHTTVRLAGPSPITMEAYRYGGICIRTREDWNDQTAEMLTSEDFPRRS